MLNEKQKIAMAAMRSGANVFLSGEAGTGKSFVLNQFLAECNPKETLICAATGVAAINIHGTTIHRAFGAPIGPILSEPAGASEVIRSAKRIIIDEISMCRSDLFDFVAKTIFLADEMGEREVEETGDI